MYLFTLPHFWQCPMFADKSCKFCTMALFLWWWGATRLKMLSSPDEPELIRIQKIIKLENIIAAIWVYMFNKGRRAEGSISPQYDKGWICCHAGTKDSHKCHTPNHKMNMQKKVMKQIFQMYKMLKNFLYPAPPRKRVFACWYFGHTDSFCLQFVENYTTSCSIAYISLCMPYMCVYVRL